MALRLQCRAENPQCALSTGSSVLITSSLPVMRCDVCCSEPGFCPQCKCILCSGEIAQRAPASSLIESIQCLHKVSSAGAVCGHSAHLQCAIECCMAGVVEESGLDVEYLCRRCDRTTDLLPRISLLVEAAAAAPNKAIAEANVKLALALITNTRREALERIETLVRASLFEAEHGGDVQAALTRMCDDPLPPIAGGWSSPQVDVKPHRTSLAVLADREKIIEMDRSKVDGGALARARALMPPRSSSALTLTPPEALESEYEAQIERAIQRLKRSQEEELAAARTRLAEQKNRILGLHQRISSASLKDQASAEVCEAFLADSLEQLERLKRARAEFEAMLQIGLGFGRVPQELLRSSFRWL